MMTGKLQGLSQTTLTILLALRLVGGAAIAQPGARPSVGHARRLRNACRFEHDRYWSVERGHGNLEGRRFYPRVARVEWTVRGE